jgi:DNA-binding response OmpR family regulator
MFIPEPLLAGKRVLIVEDESMVAMLIEGLLEECECSIVGPCGTFEKALEAARTETFDLAVLDVNLRGTMVCAKPFKGNDLVKMMSAALLAEAH